MKSFTDHRNHTGNQEVMEARKRFSGVDLGASFTGMLVAIGSLVLLSALFSIFGTLGYDFIQQQDEQTQVGAGAALGALALFIAYLIGGWAAARAARYSGALNGFMIVVWTLITAAIFGALAWVVNDTNALSNDMIPSWLTSDEFTSSALISAAFGLLIMLLGSIAGGRAGSHYHKRVDAAIAVAVATSSHDTIVRETKPVTVTKSEPIIPAAEADGVIEDDANHVTSMAGVDGDSVVVDTTREVRD